MGKLGCRGLCPHPLQERTSPDVPRLTICSIPGQPRLEPASSPVRCQWHSLEPEKEHRELGLTRVSKPPPRRSTAPICTVDVAMGGPLTGGPRSRLSRSPSRSPWVGITAGCSAAGPPAGAVSGLSGLSILKGTAQERRESVRSSSQDRMSHCRQELAQLDPPPNPGSQHFSGKQDLPYAILPPNTFSQTSPSLESLLHLFKDRAEPHSPAPTEPPLGMGAQL